MNFFKNVTSSACVDYGIQGRETTQFVCKVNPPWDRHSWDRSRLSVLERSLVEVTWHQQFVKLNLLGRTLLQRHPLLLALEIRSRNEEAINSTRNSIYLLKVLLLPTSIDVDNFYLCLSWSSTRVRLYACTNTRKFKGLDSRELYHCQG